MQDLAQFLAGLLFCAEFASGSFARPVAETWVTEIQSIPRRNAVVGCVLTQAQSKVWTNGVSASDAR